MQHHFIYPCPLGNIEIGYSENWIHSIRFTDLAADTPDAMSNDIVRRCTVQLDEYFRNERQSFDLPLLPEGTEFQKNVWRELQNIGYGETISYKTLAERVGNAKACRAVGNANGKNPICIVIPCHRVVESGGKLGGYAYGRNVKERLLSLEGNNTFNSF